MTKISRHKHPSGETVHIQTHTAGQNYGTFARVTLLDRSTVHETTTFGFGCEDAAIRAAYRWLARAKDLTPKAEA